MPDPNIIDPYAADQPEEHGIASDEELAWIERMKRFRPTAPPSDGDDEPGDPYSPGSF